MVTHVLVAYVFVVAVAGATDPQQDFTQPAMVAILAKQAVVRAFVNQVGGDDHGMGQQQTADDIQWQGGRQYQ